MGKRRDTEPAQRKPLNARQKAKQRAARAKAEQPTPTPKTCGDFGGVSEDTGAPCIQIAGWGTATLGAGCCKNHDAAAIAQIVAHKKTIIDRFGSGVVSMVKAAAECGIHVSTIFRWRQLDAEFDNHFLGAQQRSDRSRVLMVEDSMFARSVGGKAHAAETIFFLKNRDPERWKDRREVTGADGRDLIPLALIRQVLDEDDALSAPVPDSAAERD